MDTTIVVGCGSRKAAAPRPAQDLYTGSLFTLARRAVLATGREWLILSARHGLIRPNDRIAPYEQTLRTRSDVRDLADLLRAQADPGPVEVWAGRPYVDALQLADRTVASTPMAGLGIGQRMAWLQARAQELR